VSSARATMLTLALAVAASTSTSAQEPRLQDPMRPRVVSGSESAGPAEPDRLALTAVLVSDSRRIAVINGRIYRVGEKVNGEEILAIEPGAVRIRRGTASVLVKVRDSRGVTASNDGVEGQ
jgi:hypothetical protein